MTATDTTESAYAAAVIQVLREHFSDLKDPVVAAIATVAITRQERDRQDSFEFIVDDPGSARWRLKPRGDDKRRVRLAYYPVMPPGSPAGNALELVVNEALRALDGSSEGEKP